MDVEAGVAMCVNMSLIVQVWYFINHRSKMLRTISSRLASGWIKWAVRQSLG